MLSFPSNPTTGQTSTQNGRSYTFAGGNVWELTPATGGGGSGSIVEYATESAFPATGAASTIYIATDVSRAYRWSGSVYVEIGVDGGGASNWAKVDVPASATASGSLGQYAHGGGYFYVATGSNQWERAALKTWAPFTDIASLQVWLDASQPNSLYSATSGGSIVASGGVVARWEDKSGNGNHFTQSNSTYQPVYDGTGLVLAQNTGRHFQREYSITSNSMSFFAVLVVNGRDSNRHQYGRIFSGGPADPTADYANNDGILCMDFSTPSLAVYRNSATVASLAPATIGTRLVVGFTLSGGAATIYRNSSSSSGSTSTNALNIQRVRLGNNNAPETDSSLNGAYYEVIMFNDALSNTAAQSIIDYLMTKWSIA